MAYKGKPLAHLRTQKRSAMEKYFLTQGADTPQEGKTLVKMSTKIIRIENTHILNQEAATSYEGETLGTFFQEKTINITQKNEETYVFLKGSSFSGG